MERRSTAPNYEVSRQEALNLFDKKDIEQEFNPVANEDGMETLLDVIYTIVKAESKGAM